MTYIPTATYRLQLHHDFTFEKLQKIIPYLHKLGISTLYAAPVFSSGKGSTHGYDVTNPQMLNPDIGTSKQQHKIAGLLNEKKMGWLQDIVPNHMAYSTENEWLMDVLEKGPHSPYYPFFDFWNELEEPGRKQQIMAPFLGKPLQDCLTDKEIKLETREGTCYFNYYDKLYPLSLPSYVVLLENADSKKLEEAKADANELQYNYYPYIEERLKQTLHKREKEFGKWTEEFAGYPLNMQNLLDKQYYRLCWWKETEERINYRRFFTVNDLICLNIQHPEAFRVYHSYIKSMIDEGLVQGLRVDHVDGLYNPKKYLEDLRNLAGPETYLVVEKILESNEVPEQSWPVQGTTGYDFLAMTNALFVNPDAEEEFSSLYALFTGHSVAWEDLVWENKKLILHRRMQGEFDNLLTLFYNLKLNSSGYSTEEMADALSCFLLSFPVYRTYISGFPFSQTDKDVLLSTFSKAGKRIRPESGEALRSLGNVYSPDALGENDEARLKFIQRVQQISGPLEAKGLEDTTFYGYNRLISLNEVGNTPQHFGLNIASYHAKMEARQKNMPFTLNCTATHDTKRGEDARMRINALTEMPQLWKETIHSWHQINQGKKSVVNGNPAPDTNDEYFIYQSLLAFYPAEEIHDESFTERTLNYMEKALREGKRHTTWSAPNTEYEKATATFIENLLSDEGFMERFVPLARDVATIGMYKSLSQLIIKMFAPGIPDIYQGTEFPDLSMVDPDNRRAVDYEMRDNIIDDLLRKEPKGPDQLHRQLLESFSDGHLKLYLTHKFLVFRRQHPSLFSEGLYVPVQVRGIHQDKVLAFARQHEGTSCIVVAPLFPALISGSINSFSPTTWEDTALVIPADMPVSWISVTSNEEHSVSREGLLHLQDVLQKLPLALLKGGLA